MSGKRSPQLVIARTLAWAWLVACSPDHAAAPAPDPLAPRPTDAGPSLDARGAATCRRGRVKASEVVLLGESFLALTHTVSELLSQEASTAGTIGPDQHYRDLSVVGAELTRGAILEQYQRARQEAPPKVAVVSAGLYDVLLGGRCASASASEPGCAEIATSLAALFGQMGADGVEDVVTMFYPDPTKLGARIKPAMDALRPQFQQLCANTNSPRCHWLDLRPVWQDHPEFSVDGLHPTTAGAQAAAHALWETMRASCIAQ